jgi:hypothetical protein
MPYSRRIYNKVVARSKNVLRGVASGKLLPRA